MPMELLPGWIQVVATYNPMSYVASAFQQLIIRGFDFGVILAAFLVIIASGIITLSGASPMFRRTISGYVLRWDSDGDVPSSGRISNPGNEVADDTQAL